MTEKVLAEIAAERQRQIAKDFDAQYDDTHNADHQLLYNVADIVNGVLPGEDQRFFEDDYGILDKYFDDPRKRLVIAAALLVAEIERMDRANR